MKRHKKRLVVKGLTLAFAAAAIGAPAAQARPVIGHTDRSPESTTPLTVRQGSSSSPASYSPAAYRALVLRSEGMNARYQQVNAYPNEVRTESETALAQAAYPNEVRTESETALAQESNIAASGTPAAIPDSPYQTPSLAITMPSAAPQVSGNQTQTYGRVLPSTRSGVGIRNSTVSAGTVSTSNTIDWTSAGVGFVTALGAALLLAGAMLASRRNTGRHAPA